MVTTSPGQVKVIIDANHKVSTGRASNSTASLVNTGDNKAKISQLYFTLQTVKRMLVDVIVQGIPSIARAVVNKSEQDSRKFQLVVEGLGLQAVMGTPGVDGAQTTTNHIMEMEKVLGIEAARELVMQEVKYIFSRYGLSIDTRHLKLLADVMSYRGQILGITRFGIAKMKESVLMLASFEKTADHLFDAACHARKDAIDGVSECIIVGNAIQLGTGTFKLLSKWDSSKLSKSEPSLAPRKKLLLD
jgi:DNA-directed RNA polymerase III subunit RPC1